MWKNSPKHLSMLITHVFPSVFRRIWSHIPGSWASLTPMASSELPMVLHDAPREQAARPFCQRRSAIATNFYSRRSHKNRHHQNPVKPYAARISTCTIYQYTLLANLLPIDYRLLTWCSFDRCSTLYHSITATEGEGAELWLAEVAGTYNVTNSTRY